MVNINLTIKIALIFKCLLFTCIYIFKGVVLEEGNHSELMHNEKFYYKLQNQSH